MMQPSPQTILRRNSKSFYWASRFLGRSVAADVTELYVFCRAVDDIADKNSDKKQAAATLQACLTQLKTLQIHDQALVGVLKLAQEKKIDKHDLELLIQGVISDLSLGILIDEAQLLHYCYLVAGTVGLMMCQLLGATAPDAKYFALDLGIAMQLTNILRDVAEDARLGRQYIPQEWLPKGVNLLHRRADTAELAQPALKRLFDLAQAYYASAYAGLIYLPLRSRLSILIAARLYQEIGIQSQRQHFPVWQRRVVVSSARKLYLVAGCIVRLMSDALLAKSAPRHNRKLHQALLPWLGRF